MDIRAAIALRLTVLEPEVFEFHDDSGLHRGHAGNRGGGHYRITVVSPVFDTLSRIQRHRLIHQALKDLFDQGHIHALALSAQTAEEYFNQPPINP